MSKASCPGHYNNDVMVLKPCRGLINDSSKFQSREIRVSVLSVGCHAGATRHASDLPTVHGYARLYLTIPSADIVHMFGEH